MVNNLNSKSSAVPQKSNGCTVLMLDTDISSLKLGEKYFISKGYKFIPVSDPRTILNQIKSVKPGIILIELSLDKINGINVIKVLRKRGINNPIIVFSSGISRESLDALKSLKIIDYFPKPVNFEKLGKKIHLILNAKKTHPGEKPAAPKMKSKQWPPPTVLILSDNENLLNEPEKVVPKIIIDKFGLRIFSKSEFQDAVKILKDLDSNIHLFLVDAANENKIKTMLRLLKIIESKLNVPTFFFSEMFSQKLKNFLNDLDFFNLIRCSLNPTKDVINKFEEALSSKSKGKKEKTSRRPQNILKQIKTIKTLPPLPEIYLKIEKLSHDPEATSKQYAEILELDPAITARLLRMTNSTFYSFKRKIKSVKDTVTLMGSNEILSLVRLACISNSMKTKKDVEAVVKKVWEHSAACAITAKLLYEKTDIMKTANIGDELFICGIIHDLGKVILWDFFPDVYMSVMLTPDISSYPTCMEEEKVMGASHTDVGSVLADFWKLPEPLKDVITFHHKPMARSDSDLVKGIHIANIISKMVMGIIPEDEDPGFAPELLDAIGYDVDKLREITGKLESEIKDNVSIVTKMVTG